ncbi:MAG: hypothetical protein WA364_23575 [Candidatus Nitrosopolaris sp.]
MSHEDSIVMRNIGGVDIAICSGIWVGTVNSQGGGPPETVQPTDAD